MAISTTYTYSFALALPQKVHDFRSGGSAINCALYLSSANLDANTAGYTVAGESSGVGYTARGQLVTNITPLRSGNIVYWNYVSPVVWSNTTLSARGCLFFDTTESDASISCHDFGADFNIVNGDFTVVMPSNDAASALYRQQIT